MNLKASIQQPPPPTQDKHFTLKATLSRIWNESTLTYRCCPLCWTSMHEGRVYPSGCPKETCPHKYGRYTHRYKANVEVIDPTGRATLTLFDQPSEELFNASSTDINNLQNKPGSAEKINTITCAPLNKQFLFHIRVTTANHRYISNMYSCGYTAESIEWVPRAYNVTYVLQPASLLQLPSPSSSQHLAKGKSIVSATYVSSATSSSGTSTPTPSTSSD